MDRPHKTEEQQRTFVEAAEERARRALAGTGAVSRTFTLAGKKLRLLFAGDRLVSQLTMALSHLRVSDDGDADATVIVWDSESTGLAMVEPPCSWRDFSTRGDLWGFHSPRYRIAFHWVESSVNVFDLETSTGAYWVPSERALPYWVRASPLRSILHWWAQRNGWHLLHGAAVGNELGALLISGSGGAGKSTTALVSMLRGLRYVADDYLVARLEPRPAVHSLYCTAKITPEELDRFPEVAPYVINRASLSREKALLVLGGPWSERLERELPLSAIVTPVIEDRATSALVPASREIVKRATTFTTLEQLPYAGERTRDFVERLVACLPSYELRLGRDFEDIPGRISAFLRERPWLAAEAFAVSEPRSRPLVSVVVPTYNGARFLPDAIGSILEQDYPALQIIVVNDCSTDDTDDCVARLPVAVHYVKHDRRNGPAEARNRGIRDAVGEYVGFLDVDDLWPSGNLHRLVDYLLAHHDCDVVRGHGQLLELEPRTGRFEFRGNPRESFPSYIGAGLYRRRVFDRVGLFDRRLEFAEDTDWYSRASELGAVIERLDEVTLHVRRHGQNMTTGKSVTELNVLRAFKLALDRKRARVAEGQADPSSLGQKI